MPETTSLVTPSTQLFRITTVPSGMLTGAPSFMRIPEGGIYTVRQAEAQPFLSSGEQSSPILAKLLGRQLSTTFGKPGEQETQQIQAEIAQAQADDFKKYENYEIDGVISGEPPEQMPTMREFISGVHGQAITNKPVDTAGKVNEEDHGDSSSDEEKLPQFVDAPASSVKADATIMAAEIEIPSEDVYRDSSSDEDSLSELIGHYPNLKPEASPSATTAEIEIPSTEVTRRALDTSGEEASATPAKQVKQ